jgi:uncharacterized protein (DUF58 family)
MGRGRLTYIALLAALFVLHVMLVDYISYYIIIFFLLLPCVSLLVTFVFCRDSVVGMRVTSATARGTVMKGDKIVLELQVRNPSFVQVRTRIDIAIRNELACDEKYETIVVPAEKRGCLVEQPVFPGRSGKVSFRIVGTGIYDPLGIFCLKTRRANSGSASLLVFPDAVPVAGVERDSPVARDVENDGLMRVVKGDDPSELYDIREYRPGDLISRIHWKLSHKSGRLMVKELGRVVCGDMLVMLDLNGGIREADTLLGALASVSAYLSQAGTAHDIEWYSGRGHCVNRSHVASAEDGRNVLSSILSDGRLQTEPSVLYGRCRGGKRNPYSKVIYMCSSVGMSSGDLPALMKEIPDAATSVLMVSEEGNGMSALAEEAVTAPRVLYARPDDAAAVLKESAL